jgi:hypothetical protein
MLRHRVFRREAWLVYLAIGTVPIRIIHGQPIQLLLIYIIEYISLAYLPTSGHTSFVSMMKRGGMRNVCAVGVATSFTQASPTQDPYTRMRSHCHYFAHPNTSLLADDKRYTAGSMP